MSIAKMKKLSAICHLSKREELLENLMAMGIVELTQQDDKIKDDIWSSLVNKGEDERSLSDYESNITRVNQALEMMEKFSVGKKPLLHTRRLIPFEMFEKKSQGMNMIEERVNFVNSLASRYGEILGAINKTESLRLSLKPWDEYDLPLDDQGTRTTDIITGVIPSIADADKFITNMYERVQESEAEIIYSDGEQHYIFVVYHKSKRNFADDVFREFGFSKISFPGLEGTARENLEKSQEKIAGLLAEKQEVEATISSCLEYKEDMEFLYDNLIIQRDKAATGKKTLVTDKTFLLEGWLPAKDEKRVEAILIKAQCYYEIKEPAKGEKTPVLLLNGHFSSPFEAITKLYALPGSNSVDATPFFALSYAIFFGMMLGDAAYGIILTLITGIILKKYSLEGMKYQMVKMFFYCGIATTFWGAMFGGWFGNLATIIGSTFFNVQISIPAIWFDPLAEPMKLLMFCFILGGIHLFVGMGLNAWLSIKDGRLLDALYDVGLWYLLLIGSTLLLAGVAPTVAKWMAIIGAVGILLTAGRDRKGLVGKAIGGLGSLYGITGYLSDVLSYSRLLALGLASGVIASVVNTMGSFGGSGLKGIILMVIAFAIGHTYNFAINGLGSFVHSCRLQYVEFFGKFYESGGEAFEPLGENTKYIYIQREEN